MPSDPKAINVDEPLGGRWQEQTESTTAGTDYFLAAVRNRSVSILLALTAPFLAYLSYATKWNEIPWPGRYLNGDDVIYLGFAKNFSQNWTLYSYPRLAAPFEFTSHDFPFYTYVNFVQIGLIDVFVRNIHISVLLFHLLSISLAALSMWWLLSRLQIDPALKFVAALAYGLTPYTLTRNIGHLDYAVIWLFPLMLVCIDLALQADTEPAAGTRRLHLVAAAALGFVAPLQQMYYAFFIVIFCLSLSVFYAWPKRLWQTLYSLVAMLGGIVSSFSLFYLAYQYAQYASVGRNVVYTSRLVYNSFFLSVPLSLLVLPQEFHRLFGKVKTDFYNQMSFNGQYVDIFTNSLGLFASIGFVYLCVRALTPVRVANPFPMSKIAVVDQRMSWLAILSLLTLVCVFYAVPGGGAVLIAYFVSPQFHGVERIVPAFACFGVAGAALLLQSGFERLNVWLMERHQLDAYSNSRPAAILALLGCGLIYTDQTLDFSKRTYFAPDNLTAPARMAADIEFFGSVEKRLPAGAAIYQFPAATWGGLQPWESQQLKPFLATDKLIWSAESMWGRQSYQWAVELSQLDFTEQLARLKDKGFSAISVNTAIYETARKDTPFKYKLPLPEFLALLEKAADGPPIVSADGVHRVYLLPGYKDAHLVRNCESYAPGTKIDLTDKAKNARYLDIGWATPPSPDGVWMVTNYADRSVMRLCLTSPPTRDLMLEVEHLPNLNQDGETISVQIVANGITVGSADYAFGKSLGEQKLVAKIPADVARRRATLDLHFHYLRTGGDKIVGPRVRSVTLSAADAG